ncbi:tyrosine-type recombinase/integrase [Brachybacterium sp. AOP42-C2-15]|uniref:tyrosine-type recombinase/integrase n=1 Tax=Brachybacterium sp. AOP42-C2-15 TaxID=3457670 RepID=UPI0040348524
MAKNRLAAGEAGAVQVTAYDKDGNKDATGRAISYYIANTRYGALDGGRPVRVQARGRNRSVAEDAVKRKAREQYAARLEAMGAKDAAMSIPSTWDGFAALHLAWIESDDSDYSDATMRVYTGAMKHHVLTEGHEFNGRELSSLAHLELREWLQGIANDHGNGAAHSVKSVVGGMFKRAVGYGIVSAPGPMAGMGAVKRSRRTEAKVKTETERKALEDGKVLRERDTDRALTAEDQERLLTFIEKDKRTNDNDTADLIRFMLSTGVRIGEALALRWEDVKLTGKSPSVSINGTLGRVKGQGIVRQAWTKTEAGERFVYIGSDTADLLRERYARMTEIGQEKPLPMSPEGAVFPSINGTWRDQSNVNDAMRHVFDHEDVNVPWATTHTFRKTVVTDLLNAGMSPNQVAAHVGHGDASFTLRTYADSVTAPKDAGNLLQLARAGRKKPTIEPTAPEKRHLRAV